MPLREQAAHHRSAAARSELQVEQAVLREPMVLRESQLVEEMRQRSAAARWALRLAQEVL